MQHVADDGHGQPAEVLLVVPDREQVEQALRRVRVAAVAGVDHVHVRAAGAVQVRGDQVRGAGLRMPDDEHVGVHRHEVVDGVEQRLALARRRRADVEVDHVGGQPLGGDLERRPRARRVLEEQVEHRPAAQQRHLLHVALGDRHERHRGVEDADDDLGRQALERQQVRELAGGVELRVMHLPPPRRARTGRRRRAKARWRDRARPRAARRRRSPRSAARGRRDRRARRARCARAGRSRTAR